MKREVRGSDGTEPSGLGPFPFVIAAIFFFLFLFCLQMHLRSSDYDDGMMINDRDSTTDGTTTHGKVQEAAAAAMEPASKVKLFSKSCGLFSRQSASSNGTDGNVPARAHPQTTERTLISSDLSPFWKRNYTKNLGSEISAMIKT